MSKNSSGRSSASRAEVVDGLADGPELRRGDELALHQAAGGLVLDRPASVSMAARSMLGHGAPGPAARLSSSRSSTTSAASSESSLADGLGQRGGRHVLQHVLADLGVELGEDLGQGLVIEVRDQLFAVASADRKPIRSATSAGCRALEQLAQPVARRRGRARPTTCGDESGFRA